MIEFQAAALNDVEAIAGVYLHARKELVGCTPLVHSDEASAGVGPAQVIENSRQ